MDAVTIQYFDHEHLWLHLVVHLVLVVTPVVLGILVIGSLMRTLRAYLLQKQTTLSAEDTEIGSLPRNVLGFISKYSLKSQVLLGAGALLTLPVTYAGLELPKQIINNALSAESIGTLTSHTNNNQINLLLILCTLYLLVLIVNGGLKFFLNYYKGKLSERLIRRLRLYIFHKKRRSKDSDNSNIIPVLIQEIEPVCGFSGDSIIVPLLQGGTAITVIVFMMIQDVALGVSAIALLPIQLLIIPKFQRRINKLVHLRIGLIRNLSERLQSNEHTDDIDHNQTIGLFSRLQEIRVKLFRVKYLSKTINNFIMNLTPFFFYTIGGYLVIEGRLSIGALVASLASYKDLAPAIREMFTYYQSYQNSRVRYDEIFEYTNRNYSVAEIN